MAIRNGRWAAVILCVLLTVVGCGSSASDGNGASGNRPAGSDVTITVPADAPTISDAVALAKPGDLVLISSGTYHETVTVSTPRITVRGVSRSGAVIDGGLSQSNGIVVTAPGVAIENLTVQNNLQNGILITGSDYASSGSAGSGGYDTGDEPVQFLKSFLVSHVTATRNGLYGIYAFSAQDGVIKDSYVSGGADSGIYVGQCKPCQVVVRDNIAELNAVGFEGTNASGDIYVVGNRLVGNRVGATTNANHQEKLLPQQGAIVAGNLIAANQEQATPMQATGGWGIGIGVDGGSDNRFVHNRIETNATAGVVITATEDIPADGNRIEDNVFSGNGVGVAFAFPNGQRGRQNCLAGNTLATTLPEGLVADARCPNPDAVPPAASLPSMSAPAGIAFSDVAAPPKQPELPHAATSGATTVPKSPTLPDVSDVVVPSAKLLAGHALVQVNSSAS